MKKFDWRIMGQIVILLSLFYFMVFSFLRGDSFGAIFSFFTFFALAILMKEDVRYDCNIPYKMKENKKRSLKRALIGLLAGVHYVHFMFTYNHERFNTQVERPETIECYFGWFWFVLWVFYFLASFWISKSFSGGWYLIFPFILVSTNLFDFFFRSKKT